ncbi:u36-Nephitoxin-Nsp1a_1 [Caerostris darwini]|uniref:U36-Nephitoxin-Nsp1a_1 n=1 Tax=Caerostris darwini TaxID=1538125 RepID=A0AAV4UQU8_9ARAC|nr:u36-Nephitoxin-Nsp1a_1 [Caerostris darwini]
MNILALALLSCLLPAALCWDYPGFEGDNNDCPTVREKLSKDPEMKWFMPKCNADGTFQNLQCFDNHPHYSHPCMCITSEGTLIVALTEEFNITTCACPVAQWNVLTQYFTRQDVLLCADDGSFAPLQCSEITNNCWCVDRDGNQLTPKSKYIHSCDPVSRV